jgi:hypothetical protein
MSVAPWDRFDTAALVVNPSVVRTRESPLSIVFELHRGAAVCAAVLEGAQSPVAVLNNDRDPADLVGKEGIRVIE